MMMMKIMVGRSYQGTIRWLFSMMMVVKKNEERRGTRRRKRMKSWPDHIKWTTLFTSSLCIHNLFLKRYIWHGTAWAFLLLLLVVKEEEEEEEEQRKRIKDKPGMKRG